MEGAVTARPRSPSERCGQEKPVRIGAEGLAGSDLSSRHHRSRRRRSHRRRSSHGSLSHEGAGGRALRASSPPWRKFLPASAYFLCAREEEAGLFCVDCFYPLDRAGWWILGLKAPLALPQAGHRISVRANLLMVKEEFSVMCVIRGGWSSVVPIKSNC